MIALLRQPWWSNKQQKKMINTKQDSKALEKALTELPLIVFDILRNSEHNKLQEKTVSELKLII